MTVPRTATRERPNLPAFAWPLPPETPGRDVWYSLVSHPERPLALWHRYTLVSTVDGRREGRVWVGLTDHERPDRSVFATRQVPLAAVTVETDPFRLSLGDVGELTDRSAEGRVETDDGPVEWSFAYDPDAVTFTPLRSERATDLAVRVLGAGRHWSVNESVAMDGTLAVGDREVAFAGAPGHQGHTAGTDAPDSWCWVHCNDFDDASVVLEALRVEDGPLSVCLRLDGEVHELNRLHHLFGPRANRSERVDVGDWVFRASGEGVRLRARVGVPDDADWRRVAYLTPDGSLRYNAHCSLSTVDLRVVEGDGPPRRYRSEAGRAEWVERSPPVAGGYRPGEWTGDGP